MRQATHRSAVTRATPAKHIRVARITVSRIVPTSSFSAAVTAPARRLRIGWSAKAVSIGVRPAAEHVEAVRETAALLEEFLQS